MSKSGFRTMLRVFYLKILGILETDLEHLAIGAGFYCLNYTNHNL